MNAAFDPRPVTRLFATRRAVFPLALCSMWGLGVAWAIAVMGFNRVEGRTDDADLVPRMLTVLVVALPATIGLLVGVAAAEVRRRPVTRLLPGIHDSVARASLVIGATTCMLVALGVGPQLEGVGVIAALAGAALGYVLGLWALVPRPGTLEWLLRVGLLLGAYFMAQPLCDALTTEPRAAVLVLVAAGFGHTWRFGQVQREQPRSATEHSPFTNRQVEVGGGEHVLGNATRGPVAPMLPASPSSRQRWRALERFELQARGAGRWFAILAAVSLGVGLVPHLIETLLRGRWPDSVGSLAQAVRTSLLTGLDRARSVSFAGETGASAAAVVLATTFSRSVLRGGLWRPIPRRLAARLEFQRHLRSVGGAALLLLTMGAALVVLAGALGGASTEASMEHPPRFVAIVLLVAAAAPWFHSVLVLLDRTRFAESPLFAVAAVVLGMQIAAPLVGGAHAALGDYCGGHVTWAALFITSMGAWLPGIAVLATLLLAQARRVDMPLR